MQRITFILYYKGLVQKIKYLYNLFYDSVKNLEEKL